MTASAPMASFLLLAAVLLTFLVACCAVAVNAREGSLGAPGSRRFGAGLDWVSGVVQRLRGGGKSSLRDKKRAEKYNRQKEVCAAELPHMACLLSKASLRVCMI